MRARDGLVRAVRGDGLPADFLLAALLWVAQALLWALSPRQFWPPSWPLALAWLALGTAPVALRRIQPWWAVVWVAAHTVAGLLIAALHVELNSSAILVVSYSVAAYLPLWQAVAATVLIWVPGSVATISQGALTQGTMRLPVPYFVVFNLMVAAVCFFVGRSVRTRRAFTAALQDRARTDAVTQRALTAQAVADERRRIARELHDVVAHHVSVMGVLATGSRRTLRRDPAAVDEALATIEETGRSALREMRRLLDVLRTDDSEPAGELAPQPGLAGIGVLVEQIREAGLPATLHIDGEPAALDPGVSLTAYRIVQEALTNALKHAGAATVEVRLTFGAYCLILEVCDTGRGPRAEAARIGHGLLGMRERVSLYGGSLRTGPRPGGGYRVYAKIPLESTGSSGAADDPAATDIAEPTAPTAAVEVEVAAAVVSDATVDDDTEMGDTTMKGAAT